MHPSRSFLLSALLAAGATTAAPAAEIHDQMILLASGFRVEAPLPAGPVGPTSAIDPQVGALVALPDGRILAGVTELVTGGPMGPPVLIGTLAELLPDGSLRTIVSASAIVPGEPNPNIFDLELDQRGRLYVLVHSFPTGVLHLRQIDPVTGSVLASPALEAPITSIATAPDGLWALGAGQLRHLDPDSGRLGPPVATLEGAVNITADSAGRLYFTRACTPECSPLAFFDPATGGPAQEAPAELHAGMSGVPVIAIRRRCYESDTARCLGGRFRTEVAYTAFDGLGGAGRLVPDRSRDTSLFYFFSPDNWELMIKALDGCALNDHFWVYAAASTDVAYTLTVTDTVTGAAKIYRNPLGTLAPAITDGEAFACTP